MAALGASKGGSAADDDGGVANCWRPAGTCTSRSFAAACSAGGAGGPDGLETASGAPWSCDLNAAATSPGDLLRAGACAWWLSCCSALRLPGCSPGASLAFHSTRIGYLFHPVGAQRCRLGGLGDRTSHAPGLRGGPTSGAAPLRIIKSFFRAIFCAVIPSSIGIAPTLEPSQSCVIGSDNAGTKPPH